MNIRSGVSFPQIPQPLFTRAGNIRLGSFQGGVDTDVVAPRRPLGSLAALKKLARRTFREKRWQYLCIASEEVLVACAIVDAGYAGNAFITLVDLRSGQTVVDRSFLGMPGLLLSVNQRPGRGALASFSKPGVEIELARPEHSSSYRFSVSMPELSVKAVLQVAPAPPPLAVAASPRNGEFVYTQKSNLLPAEGFISAGMREWELKGALGGLDFTLGELPRETEWRWGFALGRADEGTAVGFNVSDANHLGGQGENALWLGSELTSIAPVRFEYSPDAPLSPWKLTSEDRVLDLDFLPKGIHRENRELVLVSSRFAQVSGHFSGTIRGPAGQELRVERLPGVLEDQRVKW